MSMQKTFNFVSNPFTNNREVAILVSIYLNKQVEEDEENNSNKVHGLKNLKSGLKFETLEVILKPFDTQCLNIVLSYTRFN